MGFEFEEIVVEKFSKLMKVINKAFSKLNKFQASLIQRKPSKAHLDQTAKNQR